MNRSIEADRTALLVVDMQLFFLDSRFWAGIDEAVSIVPAINRLAATLRSAGGLVVWIQTDGSMAACGDWTAYRERLGEEAWQHRCDELALGAEGAALHPDLQLDDADIRFVKTRFSAFINAPVDLDALLRARGIDSVIVTGVATDVCCESTVRDAMMLNYHVMAVEDGLAARDAAIHEASLNALCPRFADRVDSTALIAGLQGTP